MKCPKCNGSGCAICNKRGWVTTTRGAKILAEQRIDALVGIPSPQYEYKSFSANGNLHTLAAILNNPWPEIAGYDVVAVDYGGNAFTVLLRRIR